MADSHRLRVVTVAEAFVSHIETALPDLWPGKRGDLVIMAPLIQSDYPSLTKHGLIRCESKCHIVYVSMQELFPIVHSWITSTKHRAPRTHEEYWDDSFICMVEELIKASQENKLTSFVAAEINEENNSGDCFDSIQEEDDIAKDFDEDEDEVLAEMPLPGRTQSELDRRKKWLSIPRSARIAIRTLHARFGHCSRETLVQILRLAKMPEEYVNAARHLRCRGCEATVKLPTQTSKVALPPPCVFNFCLGMDVSYLHDSAGVVYQLLNIVDLGTTFQMEIVVGEGTGVPRSAHLLDTVMARWVSWAGYPKRIVLDRGTSTKGVFNSELSKAGVHLSTIGLEAPYQIGRVERRGGVWKDIAEKVIADKRITGMANISRLADEINSIVNSQYRTGGFSPSQWVLGRTQQGPGGEQHDEDTAGIIESVQERVDPTSIFAERMAWRHAAKKAFVETDSSKRVSRALLRKAAPVVKDYQVGDLISFQRNKDSNGIHANRWSPASRIIGFEKDKVIWAVCEGVPFCLSVDRVRPCNDAELLSYQMMHGDEPPEFVEPQVQQGYVDLRRPIAENKENDEKVDDEDKAKTDANLPSSSSLPAEQEVRTQEESQAEDPDKESSEEEEGAPATPRPKRQIEENKASPSPKRSQMSPPGSPTIDDPEHEFWHRPDSTESRVDEPTSTESRADEGTRSRSPPRRRSPPRGQAPPSPSYQEAADLRRMQEDEDDEPLLRTWRRTGTEGAGVDLAERRASDRAAMLAFLMEDRRLMVPAVKKHVAYQAFETKNTKKEKRGKTLNYLTESKEVREGLDISRRTEWEKWIKFTAGRACRGKELRQLLAAGHKPINMRWVDVDKNSHLRRPGGPHVPPEYKSRLCGRGDMEYVEGLRTDSPTAEIESHHILFSFAAARKLKIRTADISNAYFQGDVLDRIILMRPPSTGIPDPEYADGEAMILARVPIYGTADAGRKFWKRFKREIGNADFRESRIARALYVLEKEGYVAGMLLTHVDDMLWAVDPKYDGNVEQILKEFAVRKVEEGTFRFCGKEVKQEEDFSVVISCRDATELIDPIRYTNEGRKLTDSATEQEIAQMRSVVGSLGWIARQCRPDLSYMVSRLQGAVSKATVKDLKDTNSTVEQARDYSAAYLKFRSDAINWDDCIIVTVTDASFAQETIVEANGKTKPHRTQKAFMILLVDPSIVHNPTAGCHIWSWRSLTDKRVCRATLQGEAHGLLSGTEAGDRLRAIIADLRGKLPDMKTWYQDSAKIMRHMWLSDCESLVSHMKNPKNERLENVRLSIDIQGLKSMLWETSDGIDLDELLPENIAENSIRWIDTSCMLVDALTKRMRSEQVIATMQGGVLDLTPTPESQLLKLRKQKQRAKKRSDEQDAVEGKEETIACLESWKGQ